MNTIPTESKLRIAAAVLGGALLVPAAYFLIARLMLLSPGEEVRQALLNKQAVTDEDRVAFRQARERVAFFFADNGLLNDLALVTMAEAEKAVLTTPEGEKLFREAMERQRAALVQSPADAYGWARLAYGYLVLEGRHSEKAVLALSHSFEAAPYEPRLGVSRLTMLKLLEEVLPPDLQQQIPLRLREAVRENRRQTEQVAASLHFQDELNDVLQEKK